MLGGPVCPEAPHLADGQIAIPSVFVVPWPQTESTSRGKYFSSLLRDLAAMAVGCPKLVVVILLPGWSSPCHLGSPVGDVRYTMSDPIEDSRIENHLAST